MEEIANKMDIESVAHNLVRYCIFYIKSHNQKSHQETSLMVERAIEIAKKENENVQRFISGLYDLHKSLEDCFKMK